MGKVSLWKSVGVLILILPLVVPLAVAQKGHEGHRVGKGGMCPGCMRGGGGLAYDSASELTVTGVLGEVQERASQMGSKGIHLTLKVEPEIFEVHVGPAAFLAEKDFHLESGDQVTVTGARMGAEGSLVLLAREITKGSQVLTLRDIQGKPIWSKGVKEMKKGCCDQPM